MNGAESLIRTLVNGGVQVCFMNPGTSEIHFTAALDSTPGMRGVLCLFEGVASSAADGYARMTGKPASTLLHLGPGLSNALANLHNACRAHVPLINIVGDHAGFHRHYETPLASNVEDLARPYSAWLRTSASVPDLGRDCAEALALARQPPGHIATLIVPADVAWGEGGLAVSPAVPRGPSPLEPEKIDGAAGLLRQGKKSALLLGAGLLSGPSLVIAGQIAAATGCRLLAPFAFTRIERGAGRPRVERIAYVTDQAVQQLADIDALVLIGAPPPVAFFGHPTKPSVLTRGDARVLALTTVDQDSAGALRALADAVDAHGRIFEAQHLRRPGLPEGRVTPEGMAAVVGALIPENAIIIDETITSGRGMMAATAQSAPHDYLVNTGGSIGIAMPLAVGAAIACPERPVLCLEADGSGMYTPQALWTAAREGLAITFVIFANHSYAILKGELANHNINAGPKALQMLNIGQPNIDWVTLACALGIMATRIDSLEKFAKALDRGLASREPNLIEVSL